MNKKTFKRMYKLGMIMICVAVLIIGCVIYKHTQAHYDRVEVAHIDQVEQYMYSQGYKSVDSIDIVDSYRQGDWYVYYVCADGDCYCMTLDNGQVDMFVMMN